jgi:hypothetical protein
MMFVSTAVAAGLVESNAGVTNPSARAETIQFGTTLMLAASQTYAVRMAAVFMMSLATMGSAARKGDSFRYAAWLAGVVMIASNSIGVNRPRAAWRRRRW